MEKGRNSTALTVMGVLGLKACFTGGQLNQHQTDWEGLVPSALRDIPLTDVLAEVEKHASTHVAESSVGALAWELGQAGLADFATRADRVEAEVSRLRALVVRLAWEVTRSRE